MKEIKTLSKKIKTKIEYGIILVSDELWKSIQPILRKIPASVDIIAFLKFMMDEKVGKKEKFGPLISALIIRSERVAGLVIAYYKGKISTYREDAERMLSGA